MIPAKWLKCVYFIHFDEIAHFLINHCGIIHFSSNFVCMQKSSKYYVYAQAQRMLVTIFMLVYVSLSNLTRKMALPLCPKRRTAGTVRTTHVYIYKHLGYSWVFAMSVSFHLLTNSLGVIKSKRNAWVNERMDIWKKYKINTKSAVLGVDTFKTQKSKFAN